MSLGLGSAHRSARHLEGVGVVPDDRQLVLAAQRDACNHVEVTAHVTAGVLVSVLVLIDLQDDGAPGSVEHEVCQGAGRFRLEAAASEGQVVLVVELDARLAQELVHLQLFAFRQGFWVVAVEGLHVLPKIGRRGELHSRLAELADPIVTVGTRPSHTTVWASAVIGFCFCPHALAQALGATIWAIVLVDAVLTQAFAAAWLAVVSIVNAAMFATIVIARSHGCQSVREKASCFRLLRRATARRRT